MLDVTVVACGAPKRGMGWYHCKQMLDKRVPGAQLTDVVEPFFLGAGKDSPPGKDFAAWSQKYPGVNFHKSIGEMPKPTGPKLVLICGRTADNPRLFREAVDHGFSHIYLEKPGAPSVAELEEMAAFASAKGVPVFMGYNRNFSKYVRAAQDFAAKNPSGTITLARKDTFNTPESLDECFERNAEGMMKNMMCHELVVLLTYYGLTVDSIQEVIADQTYTCSETRKGFTDFSKVGFTIKTKSGRKYVLQGDRSGGEHAEAVVSIGGKEAFKAVRPDPEIIAQGKALEDAEPGCMPYFYLQDGEYVALKGAVVDHILNKREGRPEGVASIETAIEGLKVCDFITDALNAPNFEFKLNISNHPCSWGVDYADAPSNPPWEKVIKCIADAGFAGTELGPVGYYDPERLGGMLESFNLKLVAGNIFEKLEDPSELPGIISKVHKSCQTLQKHGAKFFVIVPHVAPERIATAGRSADAPRLPNDRWAQFMAAIKEVAEVTKSYGIQSTIHPHAGCWLEYEDEVERSMAELPADLVGLCLDTGHFTYAGMNPVEKFKKYAARIPYMHFKDIDGAVLKTLQERKEGFWQGITSGVFCPLGHGLVDYPAILRAMKACDYDGWVTVEQDADNKIDDEEAKLMGPFECCKQNLIYLQSLGVTDPRKATSAGSVRPAQAQPQGNLAFIEDTWKIMDEDLEVPLCAEISDSRIDRSESEYALQVLKDGLQKDKHGCPCAWQVGSKIKFDYRVVELPQGSLLDPECDALVFGHLAYGSAERTAAMARPQRRLVVVDEKVYTLFGAKVEAYFKARGVEYEVMTLPMSEENKSMEMTLKVCKKMKAFNIDRRHEPVIAIGGGVCLDVVGLAASMFRRRTPYIRVPTTSLAYVDASVGAKNGCNFCGSKNRLGTYVPPVAALLDCDFFKTQGSRDISNSLGEMAKMAIMKSAELFKLLDEHGPRLIEQRFQSQNESDDVPARVLRLSIETMLEELAPNLWEDSLDRLVDFGHAVGQNLEMVALGTEYELMHGEAVATDMAYMTVLSNVLGLISEAERDSILHMLRRCSVPVHNPLFTRKFFKEAMKDRVANSMGMRLPLPVGIGKARTFNDVKDEDFERAFVEWEKLCASAESRMPRPPTIMPAPTGVPGVKAYYTFPPAPNALMVDIMLREKGVGTAEIKAMEKYVDLPALDNRSPEMLEMNPQGSLPWFVLDDDTVVAETVAMMEYVEEMMPEPHLVGSNAKDRGVVRQWQRRMEEHYCYPAFYGHRSWTASEECADDHFMKNFFSQRLNAHHGASLVPKEWKTLCTWAKNRIQWLDRIKQEEAQVKGKASEFIAGDTFTIVDIQVYVTLWFFSEAFPHPPQKILQDLKGQIPWVQAWFDRVHARPACVAAREYREQNMAEKTTAQSNAANIPANVKEQMPKEIPQEMTESERANQYIKQMQVSNGGPPLSVPTFDVSGCNYIVTGGSQGLGLEIAQQLKKIGASKIAILARTRSRGEAAAAQLTSGTCTAYFVEADMANPESLQSAAAEAIAVLGGRVDGLVNAAGTTERGNLMDTTVEMFNKQFDTNTRAPFLLAQSVAKHMIEQKCPGSIVNISSLAAKGGAPFIMAYSASKSALNTLTQNNATELAPYGIRMNAINMGWTYTENENALMVAKGGPNWLSEADAQMPLKRLMRPVDVACTACFLLSPAAQMMTGNVLDLHPDTALGMLSTKTTDSIER